MGEGGILFRRNDTINTFIFFLSIFSEIWQSFSGVLTYQIHGVRPLKKALGFADITSNPIRNGHLSGHLSILQIEGRSLLVVSFIWLAMDQTPTSGWTRGTPSAALKTSLAIDWDTMQVCPRMQKYPTIISNRQWNPPSPTSADLIAVWRKLDEVQILFQDHDEIVWKPRPNGLYSLRLEPGTCILSSPAVSWHSIVWFKDWIPSQR